MTLSSNATFSDNSKGREVYEEPDLFRTIFEKDRDRIIHSKAFRRLKHKTQVFINPDGDHFITRMTHTLQVTQIGRSISKTLGLNPDLTEAICLGHDVGHSPFGHTGEDVLDEILEGGWSHSENSVKIFTKTEPLNLSHETLNGIKFHPWKYEETPETPEAMVCRFSDRIAYLTHDVEDALRAGVLSKNDIPKKIINLLGSPGKQWINNLISGVFKASTNKGIAMDSEILECMNELREFMFEKVYLREETMEERIKAKEIVENLVLNFEKKPDLLPEQYRTDQTNLENAVDYVAGMTDRFALKEFSKL
ncbi:MAG: HD domain-containing protein [Candidatus Actinomarinales bacterium]|nr:MAG: HD domain-containing protein [Candidatus Actinomarinales bacterium]